MIHACKGTGPVPDASTASARGPFFRQCSRLLFQCFFQIGHDVCRTLAHHKYDFSAGQRFDQRALGNLVLVGQIVFKRLALQRNIAFHRSLHGFGLAFLNTPMA